MDFKRFRTENKYKFKVSEPEAEHSQQLIPQEAPLNIAQQQAVASEQPIYAGFWLRLLSLVLDELIIFVVLVLPVISAVALYLCLLALFYKAFASIVLMTVMVGCVTTFALLYPSLRLWFYPVLFERSRLQGTPGKVVLGLTVSGTDGKRLGFWQASARMIVQSLFACSLSLLTLCAFNPGGLFHLTSDQLANSWLQELVAGLVFVSCYCYCFFNRRRQTVFDWIGRRLVLQKHKLGFHECSERFFNLFPKWFLQTYLMLALVPTICLLIMFSMVATAYPHIQSAQVALLKQDESLRVKEAKASLACFQGAPGLLSSLVDLAPNSSLRLSLLEKVVALEPNFENCESVIITALEEGNVAEARRWLSHLSKLSLPRDKAKWQALVSRIEAENGNRLKKKVR
jgi:uncharacterized RDD family membrane protein YckC